MCATSSVQIPLGRREYIKGGNLLQTAATRSGANAQQEITSPKSRRTQFGETDIPPLPLEGGPLLSPAQEATISGYQVPVKSRVMMSEWAIGHNLSTWEDADS
ncbi:hypothetical protein ACS0TY_022170 [Phlomoides rotata]